MTLRPYVLLIGAKSQFADLTVCRGRNSTEKVFILLFVVVQVLVKLTSFQNSFFEFALLIG